MSKIPFFKPWGFGGCLWRFLIYLLGIILICLLLSLLFKGCDGIKESIEDLKDKIEKLVDPSEESPFGPDDPYRDYPKELIDASLVDWFKPIEGVDELPDPEDNFIEPIEEDDIVTNPEDNVSQIVDNQLIVLFHSKDIEKDIASFAKQFKQHYPDNKYKIDYYNPQAAFMLLEVPERELTKVRDELPNKITNIDFIVTNNGVSNENARPSDPGFTKANYDEYFKLIQAYEAWDITRGSKDVKVAIIDSYFDLNNPELSERHVDRYHIPSHTQMVLPPRNKPNALNWGAYAHGSHVAGIAIGGQNNKLGCSGIAPECTWIPIALGDTLLDCYVLEGLMYAIHKGADVINLSIGRRFSEDANQIPLPDQVMISKTTGKRYEALWEYIGKIANEHNCVICTSAGNESLLMGLDAKNRANNIIKVEAVDGKGQKADFSNFGMVPEADIQYSTVAAPGVNLWSVTDKRCLSFAKQEGYATSKDGLQEMSGTSMASPVVAGAVALLKSKNKDLTTEEIIKILRMTAKQTDKENPIGPTIQIKDALDAATNGEKVKFDDLMKNPELLVGKWKSTGIQNIVSELTGEMQDEIWVYFTFTTPYQGFVEFRTIESRKTYKANVTVDWRSNEIFIDQQGPAVTPDQDKVNEDDYICTPNSNGLLSMNVVRNGRHRHNFELEKVN